MKSLLYLLLTSAASTVCALASDGGHAGHGRSSTGLGRPLPAGWEAAVHDNLIHYAVFVQRAEYRTGDLGDAAILEAEGWIGPDYKRFWWGLEAEQLLESPKTGEFEFRALYSRLVRPFWDFQAGLRLDRTYSGLENETRGHLVIGFEGLAPFRFELEPALALSDQGDVSFSVTASYDFLITQRLIIQPRADFLLSSADMDEHPARLDEGANEFDFSIRMRYDIRRDLSPYIGVEWHRPLGSSRDALRRVGRDGWETAFVIGLRAWF
jgi:copper resistance protein B